MTDFFNDIYNWLNHGQPYIDDLESYKWFEQHEWIPLVGGYFTREKNRLYEKENQRYWDDFYANTAPNKSLYPIKQYKKENHYVDGGDMQDLFEATESIIRLYRRW